MNFKSAFDMPRRKEGVRNETDTLSLESMPLRAGSVGRGSPHFLLTLSFKCDKIESASFLHGEPILAP